MDTIIFPIIIIILGFCYLGVTLFLYKKETIAIGIPGIPYFWMLKKESSPRYFWFSIILSVFFSFFVIVFSIKLLFEMIK